MRCFVGSIVAALGLAAGLSGCSAGSAISRLPGVGLPADAPAAPTVHYAYPAVYDTPSARAVPALTDQQQTQLKQRLTAARNREEARRPAGRKSVGPAKMAKEKNRPDSAENSESPGSRSDP